MKHEEFKTGTADKESGQINARAEVSQPIQASTGMKRKQKSNGAFRTISEVADELGVQQHVLRFWETKFTQVRPLKRGGGRRYYRPEDIDLLRSIQHLLYTDGYTIKGVQKMLKTDGKKKVMQALPEAQNSNVPVEAPLTARRLDADADVDVVDRASGLNQTQEQALRGMLDELRALRSYVETD